MKARQTAKGKGTEMPPLIEHVIIYFLQKGLIEQEAVFFFQQHEAADWKTIKGHAVKNWKTLACDWIWELQHSPKNQMKGYVIK